jgi:hypothetical protein
VLTPSAWVYDLTFPKRVSATARETRASRPRLQQRLAVSFAVAARLLPGSGSGDDAGPAEATHRAGDQGCCGVEVRGFEPLASSVRASWG